MVPVFERRVGDEWDGWYFKGLDGYDIGPYGSYDRVVEKYWLYMAYVVEAPACHHPTPPEDRTVRLETE